MRSRQFRRIASWFTFFLSLLLLRVELILKLGKTDPKTITFDIIQGILIDLVASFVLTRNKIILGVFGCLFWFTSWVSNLYLEYFGVKLSLSAVWEGLRYFHEAKKAAFALSGNWRVILSIGLLVLSGLFIPKKSVQIRTKLVKWLDLSLVGLWVLISALLSIGFPREHVTDPLALFLNRSSYKKLTQTTFPCSIDDSRVTHGNYREIASQSDSLPGADLSELSSRFNFQAGFRPHVVVLMVELLRGYEFFHPKWGRLLFPQLWKILDEHGIVFEQAYSSAINYGQTVQGEFATLCSQFDHFGTTPPTFISQPTLSTPCLPEVLRDLGYQTSWIYGHDKAFHGQENFLLRHGISTILDQKYFSNKNLPSTIGSWGLDDGPFLHEAAVEIIRRSKVGPTFSMALTLSTHYPWKDILNDFVPIELKADVAQDTQYQRYLGALSYVDGAISHFITEIFDSEMGSDTLLVLSADHSGFDYVPSLPVLGVRKEVAYRIPIAFLAKKLVNPKVEKFPIHQMDIAPTVVSLLGIAAPSAWLGQSVAEKVVHPWMVMEDQRFSYRVGDSVCYATGFLSSGRCYDLHGKDPLFTLEKDLEKLEKPGLSADVCKMFQQLQLKNNP